jgi:metallo-beta-lactamase family protein
MLEDAHKIGFTRNRRMIEGVLEVIRNRIVPLPYGQWHRVFDLGEIGLADRLVIEATYGDKNQESREHRRYRLKQVLEHALEDGGTVLIPAFSIGRTQDLLYEIDSLKPHRLWLARLRLSTIFCHHALSPSRTSLRFRYSPSIA